MNESVMHDQSLVSLDWQPVLLVNVNQQSLGQTCYCLYVNRVYLALHPDGVVCAAWDVPTTERVGSRCAMCPSIFLSGSNAQVILASHRPFPTAPGCCLTIPTCTRSWSRRKPHYNRHSITFVRSCRMSCADGGI
jgi:hypothetical protein